MSIEQIASMTLPELRRELTLNTNVLSGIERSIESVPKQVESTYLDDLAFYRRRGALIENRIAFKERRLPRREQST
jgi:hypothetical protein